MKLELGEFYLSAGGLIVKIEHEHTGDYLFADTNFATYTKDGKHKQHEKSKEDLIAHIPKELHYALMQGVNEYYTNKDFKINVDENFNNLSNKK